MKITELIKVLKNFKNEHGDLNICKRVEHDYWGHVDSYLDECDITVSSCAMPEGPKSGKTEKAIVI